MKIDILIVVEETEIARSGKRQILFKLNGMIFIFLDLDDGIVMHKSFVVSTFLELRWIDLVLDLIVVRRSSIGTYVDLKVAVFLIFLFIIDVVG